MRKAVVIIGIFLTFLITYFIQANFFNWFTIGGIKPNLFVILALYIGLFAGIKCSIPLSLFLGLFLDMVLGQNLGIYTIMLTVISILGWYFDKNFSKDNKFTIMLMVLSSTLLFEIGQYLIRVMLLGISFEPLYFIKILLVECIYNSIITIVLYPITQKIGYKIEDIFKEQKILTRYF